MSEQKEQYTIINYVTCYIAVLLCVEYMPTGYMSHSKNCHGGQYECLSKQNYTLYTTLFGTRCSQVSLVELAG